MARPLKDRTGMDGPWRMTTVRCPKWMADQLRDASRLRGLEEVWPVLVEGLNYRLPEPLPPRFEPLRERLERSRTFGGWMSIEEQEVLTG